MKLGPQLREAKHEVNPSFFNQLSTDMKTKNLIFIFCLLASCGLYAQGSPDYNGGLKVKLNEDGSKYIRFISWGQAQVNFNTDPPEDQSSSSIQLRRARVLAFSQFNKRFLILTHFGLNSLNANTLSPTGKGDGSQLFMHDMWIQYSLNDNHAVGAGLHYFNGISRLSNQSTLNMMTLDNNRASWATLGLTDQFARHIGVFAKGKFDKLRYQVAINESAASTLDSRSPETPGGVYNGRQLLGSAKAGKNFAGYFSYNFLDQESAFLPFRVGSYLGGKRVFNIGSGFFYHPNGNVNAAGEGSNVSLFAIDAFYDSPMGDNGSAITAYAVAQFNDYGEDYLLGPYGSGTMIYSHVGYVLPGDKTSTRWQPYVSFMNNSFDIDETRTRTGIGLNMYLSGHNAKLTGEWNTTSFAGNSSNAISIQAMIYM